ncbi:MAG TPA: SDR family NAD(P)-dependent oxidoreductase [Candidatus Limnocylindrales bacterium]|nr:SDR family NAD(P)-dependent oxidoreductase [Candidatus Limnocylindrales bacterium]
MKERYGPWVLVTGASSGIGREFARRLAAQGLNVVVVARRADALEELARQIRAPVQCRVIAMDLSEPGAAARLAEAVADLEIGLLVANAGTGWIGRFDLQAPEFHSRLIRLHCELTVELTARLVPAMRERGRGGIVVVSSAGAFLPLPYYAVYGGTKALLQNWGEAIAAELKGTGVDVLVVSPGDTRTGFQDVAGEMSTRWSSVEDVVGEALAGLGKKTVVVPGLENRLGLLAARLLPRSMVMSMIEKRQRAQTPRDRR